MRQRQGQRTAQLIELLDKEPDLSNTELATRLGVTRARVSQIRIEINRRPDRRKNWHPCQECGNPVKQRAKFCSRSCQLTWAGAVQLTCETCGETIVRGSARVAQRVRAGQKHVWCSKQCQGSWLGNVRRRLNNLVGR